ncbi:MAG: triose-phosphate isomerase [Bacteroidales bacterium]
MRTPLVAANWKMFKTLQEAFAYTKEFATLVQDINDVEVVIAPPFTALHTVAETARNANIGVAGQDVYFEREGAFTGEVSAAMLKNAGADYVIIGHSERRTLFGETDATVARKIAAAFGADLVPIACIGETLAEREAGQTFAVLDRQVADGLGAVPRDQVRTLVVAYEPVWAIGTGRTATAAQAQEAHAHIRKRLREHFGEEAATECRIIYGGSVKPANTRELLAQPDVDGALVGGASLDVNAFAEIVAKSRG